MRFEGFMCSLQKTRGLDDLLFFIAPIRPLFSLLRKRAHSIRLVALRAISLGVSLAPIRFNLRRTVLFRRKESRIERSNDIVTVAARGRWISALPEAKSRYRITS